MCPVHHSEFQLQDLLLRTQTSRIQENSTDKGS
jgi:hypothetical protein